MSNEGGVPKLFTENFMRVTEVDVGNAVLEILASTPGGEASIRLLKQELPKHLRLSHEDRRPSLTRDGEELWEQQVRNLVSHRKSTGNVIAEGYVSYRPRRLAITDRGRRRIAN
jgi:hypothetical protein